MKKRVFMAIVFTGIISSGAIAQETVKTPVKKEVTKSTTATVSILDLLRQSDLYCNRNYMYKHRNSIMLYSTMLLCMLQREGRRQGSRA